jgi:cell division protein FtsZ
MNRVVDKGQSKTTSKVNPIDLQKGPRIVVLGVGGCGNNAVNHLAAKDDTRSLLLVGCNTDMQDLSKLEHHNERVRRVQIGVNATHGLGAGGDPSQGAIAAEESMKEIAEHIKDAHMLFIASGMGGGTGTGASEHIAKYARDVEGILTIAVVTTPFSFEGPERMSNALRGLDRLQQSVDALVVIPNDKLSEHVKLGCSLKDAFQEVDEVLASFVSSMTRILTRSGLVNIDFADMRAALAGLGARAMFGVGEADGDDRAIEATERALSSPLLEECSLRNAPSVIVSVEGGNDMTLKDFCIASARIKEEIGDKAQCKSVFGTYLGDPSLEGKIRVTIIATLSSETYAEKESNEIGVESDMEIKETQKVGVRHGLDVDFTNQVHSKRATLHEDRAGYNFRGDLPESWAEHKGTKPQQSEGWWSRFVGRKKPVTVVRPLNNRQGRHFEDGSRK